MIPKGSKIRLKHHNAIGTGMELEIIYHGESGLNFTFMPQDTTEPPIGIMLGALEVTAIVQVLCGWYESFRDGKAFTRGYFQFDFHHIIEPTPGYLMSVKHGDKHERFLLSHEEAVMLKYAFEALIPALAFKS